jgi:4-amino-4-deoxy-L-arabinose transferase-like glycosyltransferase
MTDEYRVPMGAGAANTTTFWQRVFTWRVALGVILLLAVLVRLPFLHVPLITDEGGYAYTTHYGLSGRTLYRLLWFDRTQGILWVYRLIFQTLGQSIVAIRLFAALYNAGSALLVYVVGRRLADKRTGLLAAFLFALFSVMPHVQGFTANAELFMTLPALASLALILPGERTHMDPAARLLARVNITAAQRVFLSGVCAGIAIVIKPAEIAAVAIVSLLLFLAARQEGAPWPARLRRQSVLATGVLIGVLPALVDGFARDGRAYIRQVLLYRGATESIVSVHAFGRLGHSVWNSVVVGGDVLPLVILTALALAVYRHTLSPDARRLAPVWFLASFGGIALGGNWFTHYYFQLLPPLAIYGAIGAHAAFARGGAALWRTRLVTALILSVMLTTGYAGHYFVAEPADISWGLYHDRAYQAQAPLVEYLKENTRPNDRIYIAFEAPEIYYLCERQSAFSVVWRQPILNDPATFDRLIATLDTPAGPEFIVDLDAPRFQRAHDRLRPVLEHRYRLAAIIQGVQVYQRVPSLWNTKTTMKVDR